MRNAFDTDAGWSRGFSALASALNPDPTKRAQAIYYAQNANRARALTEQTDQQTRGAAGLSQAFLAPTADPRQLYSQAALAGQDYLGRIPEAQLGFTAATGGDDATLSRLSVGAGKPFQNTPVGVREGHATDIQQSHIAAGPGYARVAEDRRQFDVLPQVVVGPDGLLTTAPRAAVVAGRYQLPPSQDQVQGNVSQRLTAPGAAPDAVPNWRSVLAPGSVVSGEAATTRELQEPIVVMRGGVRTTIPRRDIQPTDQLVTASGDPMDQLGAAAAGGQTVAPEVAAGVAALVPPGGRSGNPPRVGPNDAKAMQANLAQALAAQLGGDVPPDVLATAVARAGARMQASNNIVSAVDETVREILALKGTTAGGWFSSPQVPGMATLPPVNGVPVAPPPPTVPGTSPPPALARSVMPVGIGRPAAAASPPAPAAAPAPQAAAAAPRPPPAPGQEINGWRYTGPPNDPAAARNRANWQRVEGNNR